MTYALDTFVNVLFARLMPAAIASSKLIVELAVIFGDPGNRRYLNLLGKKSMYGTHAWKKDEISLCDRVLGG